MMTPDLGPGLAAIGLCSMEGDGGDGGGGGGADSGGDGGAAAALAASGGDGGQGVDGGQGGEGGQSGDKDPEWLGQFSADGGDAENPANRDWLKSKGFKSLDDMAKSLREAEKTIRNGGKLTVPGADAKPEEVDAYHKAIGRPDKAEDYAFDVPDGGELDEATVNAAREAAFKAGAPAGAFKAIADAIVTSQLDQLGAMKTAEDGDFDGWKAAQGEQASQKIADANSAMRSLGLTPQDVQAMQRGYFITTGKPGSAKVMDMLAKLGAGMAEDALSGGGGQKRFGITGAEAQKEIDQLVLDGEFGKKLEAKEPAAVARWNRLNAAVAADVDRQNAAGGVSS